MDRKETVDILDKALRFVRKDPEATIGQVMELALKMKLQELGLVIEIAKQIGQAEMELDEKYGTSEQELCERYIEKREKDLRREVARLAGPQ